jgi:hypothetical protein
VQKDLERRVGKGKGGSREERGRGKSEKGYYVYYYLIFE